MEILLAFQQGTPSEPLPRHAFWQEYLKAGIEEAGHTWREVQEVNWIEGLVPKSRVAQKEWSTQAWSRTVEALKKQPDCDLFLSYLYPEQVDSSAVASVRALGIPCVNFYCDHIREFRKLPDTFTCFDLAWVPEFDALKLYSARKLAALHAPMPCYIPPRFRSLPSEEKKFCSFVGTCDHLRAALLGEVIKQVPQLRIYGSSWESAQKKNVSPERKSLWQLVQNQQHFIERHGIVALLRKFLPAGKVAEIDWEQLQTAVHNAPVGDEYFHVLQQSCVSVGINRVPKIDVGSRKLVRYSRLRDIEATMLGACYLTETTSDLLSFFPAGDEIATYSDAEELVTQLQILMKDASQRLLMRQKAQQRALNDLSIPATLSKISQRLGLPS